MEIRHLRYFIAVAEELHFARAAERLRIEQSPLSRSIRDLEEDLGVKLFVRTTRSTHLTSAGLVFLRDAREILASVAKAVHTVRDAADGRNRRLTIGFGDGLSTVRISMLLGAIRESAPAVALRVADLPGAHQFTALRSGELDISISMRLADGPDLKSEKLWTQFLAVALPSKHPLALGSAVHLDELRNEPILMCHPEFGFGCHGQVMAALRLAGFEPMISEYVYQRATALAMVAAGFGVSIVTLDVEGDTAAGVVLRPLAESKPELTIYGVTRKDDESDAVISVMALARSLE